MKNKKIILKGGTNDGKKINVPLVQDCINLHKEELPEPLKMWDTEYKILETENYIKTDGMIDDCEVWMHKT